jgi:hypothetical protein
VYTEYSGKRTIQVSGRLQTPPAATARLALHDMLLAPSCRVAAAGAPDATLAIRLGLHGGMTIKVKTLTGREIEVDIEPTDTVQRIKERLEEKEGIAPDQQRLIFSGAHHGCTSRYLVPVIVVLALAPKSLS